MERRERSGERIVRETPWGAGEEREGLGVVRVESSQGLGGVGLRGAPG